jgi:CspA family cold shock protein
MEGTVKWFNHAKRFGFIQPSDGGRDVFVHYSAIREDSAAKLKDGSRVEFEITEGEKGPQASDVRVLDEEPPSQSTAQT